MRHPNGDTYSKDRVDSAMEVLHAHAEWLINEGRVVHASVLSEASRLLGVLRDVRREEKPTGPVFPRRSW